MKIKIYLLWLVSLIQFVACSSAPTLLTNSARHPAGAAGICAQSHSGTTRDLTPGTILDICDRFYDSAPLVRIPERDDFSNSKKISFYGAIDSIMPTESLVADRNGQKWLVLNSHGALNPVYDYSAFPSSMHMPSNIYLYIVYKFEGKIAAVPPSLANLGAKGLILTSATPVIYVPGSLMDNYFLGAWEGTINERIDPAPSHLGLGVDLFTANSQAPVRVVFSALEPFSEPLASEVLALWPDNSHQGQKLQDVTVANAIGNVENFTSNVIGSDGTCFKALSALNHRNPFLGATSSAVDFYRYPSMHGGGSEAVVMSFPAGTRGIAPTGMSVPFFMKTSTLILEQAQFEANEYPHGIHFGFELSKFHKVESGGGSCQ